MNSTSHTQHEWPIDKEILLSQLEAQNPELAGLYRKMEQYVQDQHEDAETVTVSGQNEELAEAYDELVEQHNQLVDEINRLSQEKEEQQRLIHKFEKLARGQKQRLQFQARLLNEMARALGGCPQCLGRNAQCPLCHGVGAPGYMKPDERLFERLIQPALHQHQWKHAQHNPYQDS